jgi:redox-sensitive bicupin YhaK (pirin superfamily)
MKRREFIKHIVAVPFILPSFSAILKQGGNTMKKEIHRAESRGFADHGWLKSYHSFSFASYYNPERMGFGLLRVLNDDTVSPGMGFGEHPHDNMEIVSIPLKGSLEHRDSMGNKMVIGPNEVQIMSAGKGVRHSEYNHSKTEEVKFLQIWVLPKERNIKPRYEQKVFKAEERRNKFQTVVSPEQTDGALWINQDARFVLTDLKNGKALTYSLKDEAKGVYIFVLEGSIETSGETLKRRDAIGVSETMKIEIKALENAEILLIEVPMKK